MQIISQPLPRRQSGYALIMIMCFLAVSLIIFASMTYWVSSNSKITLRNNAFNQAEAAAESATESQLATMIRDYAYGALSPNGSAYVNLLPSQTGWPNQFQFSNYSINIGTTNWTPLSGEFTNLSGFVQIATNTVTATASAGPVAVPATVQQTIQFASIPIFQYAVFYNMDLEIEPGNTMNINGHVHSNNNIWTTGSSAGSPLTYQSLVDASGMVNLQGSTNSSQSGAAAAGSVIFSITNNNPLHNADSLTMPVGTNNNPAAVAGIIQIPPSGMIVPSTAAYSPTGQVYLLNAADLIITNDASGTNFSVFYDNPNTTLQLTPVPPDVPNYTYITNPISHGITTTTNYNNYSFVTNATFYDYRESDTVQAAQINVSNLVVWLTNNITVGGTNRGGAQYTLMKTNASTGISSLGVNSIYVYNSVPMNNNTLPAVRVVNGQRLPPFGLTVATAQPIYVEGNYNVQTNWSGTPNAKAENSTTNGSTVPAALMGDAITVLSSAWSDSYSLANTTASTSLAGRIPSDDTVNAACMVGIVPSANAANYSGGVENYFRLLENWSGHTYTYNGSVVCMFPSEYATNNWPGTGAVYNPPTRAWAFDVNFLKGQSYLPPLTPEAKYVIRASWAAW